MNLSTKNLLHSSIYLIVGIFIYNTIFPPSKEQFKNNKNINWEIFEISKNEINKEKYLFSEFDIKGKNKQNNKNNQFSHKIVVGIDFGTVGSGYSYSFGNDISNIKLNNKIPTEIILTKEIQNGLIYSNSAPVTMMNYNQKELSKILYIKTMKSIILSKNETINDNLCYYYPNNIILNIADDITSFFTMWKKDNKGDSKCSCYCVELYG